MTELLLPPTPEDLELIELAQDIVDKHGDGYLHSVGAAVRDTEGRMHGGINLYHFTGGPCAELVALGHARASGARELTTIVAVGDRSRGVLAPCGRDRQVLFDYHPGIRVLMPTASGVRSAPISMLLPLPYAPAPSAGAATLHFHPDYLGPVRLGTKVTTIRLGDSVAVGPVNLVFEFSQEVTVPATVTEIVGKRVDELTEADAVADGFKGLDELLDRLRFHYPAIAGSDDISIVHFTLRSA